MKINNAYDINCSVDELFDISISRLLNSFGINTIDDLLKIDDLQKLVEDLNRYFKNPNMPYFKKKINIEDIIIPLKNYGFYFYDKKEKNSITSKNCEYTNLDIKKHIAEVVHNCRNYKKTYTEEMLEFIFDLYDIVFSAKSYSVSEIRFSLLYTDLNGDIINPKIEENANIDFVLGHLNHSYFTFIDEENKTQSIFLYELLDLNEDNENIEFPISIDELFGLLKESDVYAKKVNIGTITICPQMSIQNKKSCIKLS